MSVLNEISRHLMSCGLLSDQQVDELYQMGILDPDTRYEWYEDPWTISDRWHALAETRDPTEEHELVVKHQGKSRKASNSLRADEIGKRIRSSRLLRDETLSVLSTLAGTEDWLKELHQLEPRVLAERLRALLENKALKPFPFWEALAFDDYARVVDLKTERGPAVTAWRHILTGCAPSDLGKRGWILGRRKAINKVWQLIRGQNVVLKALAILMEEELRLLGDWSESDFHPVGSLCLCVYYESLAKQRGVRTTPVQRPDWSWDGQRYQKTKWSNWDGQRYRKTKWSPTTSSSRAWEIAMRMNGSITYPFFLKVVASEIPLHMDHPLTHPRYWTEHT